ncbi:MAG TPA: ZIP family metal transporter [Candidatus Paceibacterota bacterium]|nr:ZIP family metal transporter [Candidatus Paceibacterota bacterium]
MPVLFIAIAAFCSTMLGGAFALKLRDKLHLILGFSAGAVVAVAFFDLLPEALELGSARYAGATILSITAAGFFTYLLIDRFLLLHTHEHDDEPHAHEHTARRGIAGASALSFHSLLDGIGIGLAFQVSTAVGVIVAAAVLTHDFSDGINTVNMIIKNAGERARALRWLIVDARAPVLGVAITMLFAVTDEHLGLLLALFAGFFLYIGASDLIPESHHRHPAAWTTLSTVLGALVLFIAIKIAG